MITLTQFIELSFTFENLIEFLCQHGVLPRQRNCPRCGRELKFYMKSLNFRCNTSFWECKKKQKRVRKQCGFGQSARKGTWFEKCKLDVVTICRFVAFFLLTKAPRQEIAKIETGIKSASAIVDWLSFCREVCVYWAEKQSEKLGGPGQVIEIHEAKIGKTSLHRVDLLKGQWTFVGLERESKKMFISPVSDKSPDTLLECIKAWTLPGTTIVSDCWRSYNCLATEGFQQLTDNHSYNFVDPTGAHKRYIERAWREVRGKVPRFGNREYHFLGIFCEFLFKRCYFYPERIESFFSIIGEMYPPKSDAEDQPGTSAEPNTTS